jgi:hypothetical protein
MCITGEEARDQNTIGILHLIVDPVAMPHFYSILQSGFLVRSPTRISIRGFLCDWLDLPSQYVDERISTVFLDGKPVDDIDSAFIREGAALALSSAMPGLVGATMRRAGYYSTMRNSITYIERTGSNPGKPLMFTVKLFNLLLARLGPLFLKRGIYLRALELTRFLLRQPPGFYEGCRGATIDGRDQDITSLSRHEWPHETEWVCLVVTTESDNKSGDG